MSDMLCAHTTTSGSPCEAHRLPDSDFRVFHDAIQAVVPPTPFAFQPEENDPSTSQAREQAINKQSTSTPATDPSSFPLPPRSVSPRGGGSPAPRTPWVRANPRVQPDEQDEQQGSAHTGEQDRNKTGTRPEQAPQPRTGCGALLLQRD